MLEILSQSISYVYSNQAEQVDLSDHSYQLGDPRSWNQKIVSRADDVMWSINECCTNPETEQLNKLKLYLDLLCRVKNKFTELPDERKALDRFAERIEEKGLSLFIKKETDHMLAIREVRIALQTIEDFLDQPAKNNIN